MPAPTSSPSSTMTWSRRLIRSSAWLPASAPTGWAAASPLLTYHHAPERIWFARIRYHPVLGYTRHLDQGRTLAGAGIAQGSFLHSDYLPLTACFFTRAAFEKAGLVEERLFVSHDDVEWFLRARKAGLTWGVLAEPLVRHKVSVTVGAGGGDLPSTLVAYYWGRNSLLVGRLHFPGARPDPVPLRPVRPLLPVSSLSPGPRPPLGRPRRLHPRHRRRPQAATALARLTPARPAACFGYPDPNGLDDRAGESRRIPLPRSYLAWRPALGRGDRHRPPGARHPYRRLPRARQRRQPGSRAPAARRIHPGRRRPPPDQHLRRQPRPSRLLRPRRPRRRF